MMINAEKLSSLLKTTYIAAQFYASLSEFTCDCVIVGIMCKETSEKQIRWLFLSSPYKRLSYDVAVIQWITS